MKIAPYVHHLTQQPNYRLRRKGPRNYKKLVDRGLTVPFVRILAKEWDTDYETAHRMIREKPLDNIYDTGQTTAQAKTTHSSQGQQIYHIHP